jgi:AAA domain-containing protein
VGGAAIKIDGDQDVEYGLTICEGFETGMAGRDLGLRPVWALGSAGAIGSFPLLSGIDALTILAETDDRGANARAVRTCGDRWAAADRDVLVATPRVRRVARMKIPAPTPRAAQVVTIERYVSNRPGDLPPIDEAPPHTTIPDWPTGRSHEGDHDHVPRQTVPITDKTIKTVSFLTLLEEDVVEEPDYIEPDFAGPGQFVLIAGPPKAQKSLLLQEMLVSCALGAPFLLNTFTVARPLRVFWLQAEMNRKLLRKRAREFDDLTTGERELLGRNLVISERFRMLLNDDGVKKTVDTIRASFPDWTDARRNRDRSAGQRIRRRRRKP